MAAANLFFAKVYTMCEVGIGVMLGVMLLAYFARKALYA